MSFQQGLSGLNAASKNLDVIGNNVANASTWVSSRASAVCRPLRQFAVRFGRLAGGDWCEGGAGDPEFTQGNITSTNNPLDVAINGGGFSAWITVAKLPISATASSSSTKWVLSSTDRSKLTGYTAMPAGCCRPGQQRLEHQHRRSATHITTEVNAVLNLDSGSRSFRRFRRSILPTRPPSPIQPRLRCMTAWQ